MGLHVNVYRSALGDCTNGGISSTPPCLCLVNVKGPSNPNENAPAAMLVAGNIAGTLRIVPAAFVPRTNIGMVLTVGGVIQQEQRGQLGDWKEAPGWFMMGGNYAATSDSRFSEACARLLGHRSYGAVPIHDRLE